MKPITKGRTGKQEKMVVKKRRTHAHRRPFRFPHSSIVPMMTKDAPVYFNTLSNWTFLTYPPCMELFTFLLKFSLVSRRSSAASLFNGSDGFGSRNKNYNPDSQSSYIHPKPNTPGNGSKTYLQPHDHRIQIQDRLPVLTQDVQANVALKVDVRVVDLLRTLNLRRLMREVRVDRERKVERSALIHSYTQLIPHPAQYRQRKEGTTNLHPAQ
jgi:hypothetical protein